MGLTQREVVARLHRRGGHTTNRALSAMENGRGLDLGLLPELAATLGCTTTYLLGLTANPVAWQPEGWVAPSERWPAQPPAEPEPRPAGILGPDVPTGFAALGRRRPPAIESAEVSTTQAT